VGHIFSSQGLRWTGLYHEVWWCGAMLLPIQTVGVMATSAPMSVVVP